MATISHTARLVEVTASYDESPDVDSRRRSLGQFDPGQLPPGLDSNLQYSAFNNYALPGQDWLVVRCGQRVAHDTWR